MCVTSTPACKSKIVRIGFETPWSANSRTKTQGSGPLLLVTGNDAITSHGRDKAAAYLRVRRAQVGCLRRSGPGSIWRSRVPAAHWGPPRRRTLPHRPRTQREGASPARPRLAPVALIVDPQRAVSVWQDRRKLASRRPLSRRTSLALAADAWPRLLAKVQFKRCHGHLSALHRTRIPAPCGAFRAVTNPTSGRQAERKPQLR